LLLANGAAAVTLDEAAAQRRFAAALDEVCQELAQMIVRDGEGATKFVTLHISGAASAEDAHTVADAIATSPLVKTALAGNDPNWGRILAAAGRSGVRFIQSDVALWIGSTPDARLQLVAAGTPTAYQEVDAAAVFAQPEIYIHLDLGAGTGAATVWTCDLTHDYVTINADYRT
jgi:glutamate N-acetyltransferase/amino-acid N-acetyltransferase